VPELEQLFRDATDLYASLKSACERQVVRWQWATFAIRNQHPFYFERERIPRGGKLAARPAQIMSGMREYGLDGNDEVVVARNYCEFPGVFGEELFVRERSRVDSFLFGNRKDIINLIRQHFSDGRISSIDMRAIHGQHTETYRYDGSGRITSIHRSEQGWYPQERACTFTDELSYDQVGRLERVTRVYPLQREWPTGNQEVVYQRRSRPPKKRRT
jgi:hypothetical protein